MKKASPPSSLHFAASKKLIMPSSRYEEIQVLESTLHHLKLEIERLVLQKTECLRRLNDLKASTATLPVEILSVIFEYACSDTNLIPLVLGSVSSRWRDIAWATPRLWTSVQISVMAEAVKYPARYHDLLRLYFINAQYFSLSVRLLGVGGLTAAQREPTIPRREFLDLIFRENPGRLRELACTGISSTFWDDIYHCAGPMTLFSEMQTLDMGWSVTALNPDYIQLCCPNLKNVTLSGHFTPIILPWGQLTRLELYGLPVDRCVDLLFECPLLEEYHCDLPRWIHPAHSEFLPILSREDVVIPKLRDFGWWFMNEDWTNFLMDAHFPSVHHLFSLANISDFHRSSILPLPSYFIKNMPHLRSFDGDIRFIWRGPSPSGYTVDFEDENVDEGVSGVLAASKLEELSVRNLGVDDLRFIFDQLSLLHHETFWDTLPSLRTLSIHAPNISQDLFRPAVFASFVRFLHSKRSGKKIDVLKTCARIECVRFSGINSIEPPDGSPEMMARFSELKELVRRGLRIELIDFSGKITQWC